MVQTNSHLSNMHPKSWDKKEKRSDFSSFSSKKKKQKSDLKP